MGYDSREFIASVTWRFATSVPTPTALGERERDDRPRLEPVREQRGDARCETTSVLPGPAEAIIWRCPPL
jgi:hypothetical protein